MHPEGIEPPTVGLKGRCSTWLSYGCFVITSVRGCVIWYTEYSVFPQVIIINNYMSKTANILSLTAAAIGLALVAGISLMGGSSLAGETVLIRGTVKGGGDVDSISVYYTYVATAADPTKLRGLVRDVDIEDAKRYVWEEKSGSLVKRRTTSKPTPGKEVVFSGTLRDDLRVNALWIVQNYREYSMEGTVQASTLDTGFTDQGWLTVNVTGLKFRDVTPAKAFKEAQYKSKDVRVRFNGKTGFTALGKSKQADELTASQQKVTIEGEMIDEATFIASTVNEHN